MHTHKNGFSGQAHLSIGRQECYTWKNLMLSLLPPHCEITPSSEALHQPCSWCWAAIRPFTLSSDSNFTSSSSHHCTDLMGCPLPREKQQAKKRSEQEAEREEKGGKVIKRRPPSCAQTVHQLPREGATERQKHKKRGKNGGRLRGRGRKMADKPEKTLTWKTLPNTPQRIAANLKTTRSG